MNEEHIASLKELLNTKLDLTYKNLSDKIDGNNANVMTELSYIKDQVTRTNGRVTKSEDDINKLYKNSLHDHDNCPGIISLKKEVNRLDKKISELEKNNFILKVINRYPKQVIIIITVTALLFIATSGYAVIKFYNELKTIHQIYNVINNDHIE